MALGVLRGTMRDENLDRPNYIWCVTRTSMCITESIEEQGFTFYKVLLHIGIFAHSVTFILEERFSIRFFASNFLHCSEKL